MGLFYHVKATVCCLLYRDLLFTKRNAWLVEPCGDAAAPLSIDQFHPELTRNFGSLWTHSESLSVFGVSEPSSILSRSVSAGTYVTALWSSAFRSPFLTPHILELIWSNMAVTSLANSFRVINQSYEY
jgi:hypothetical protein